MKEELQVYSTVVGELPELVRKNEPMCFVPYEQARRLEQRISELERELRNVTSEYNEMLDMAYNYGR